MTNTMKTRKLNLKPNGLPLDLLSSIISYRMELCYRLGQKPYLRKMHIGGTIWRKIITYAN